MTDHSPTIQGAELPAPDIKTPERRSQNPPRSPEPEAGRVADAKLKQSEQAAFEDWLDKECPSGDVTEVHRQWLRSNAYGDWVIKQEGVAPKLLTPPAPVAQAVVGAELPLLDQPLLDLISRFGLARTDGLSEIARIDLWQELIAGIKSYAAKCVADPICNADQRAAIAASPSSAGGA